MDEFLKKDQSLTTALGPKSHLWSFTQVLSEHYEVDQRLRVAAVLQGGERRTQTRVNQSDHNYMKKQNRDQAAC